MVNTSSPSYCLLFVIAFCFAVLTSPSCLPLEAAIGGANNNSLARDFIMETVSGFLYPLKNSIDSISTIVPRMISGAWTTRIVEWQDCETYLDWKTHLRLELGTAQKRSREVTWGGLRTL